MCTDRSFRMEIQRQARLDQAIRAYAEAVVGTPDDLDPALEAASLELLEREGNTSSRQ